MLTITQTKTNKNISNNDSVIVFLLKLSDGDEKLCGLSMVDWVKKSLDDIPYIELNFDNSDLIEFLKKNSVNSKYSIILFSNTPLITKPTILKIMEYVIVKKINACKFNGGFAFNNEYLHSSEKIMFDSFLPLDNNELLIINNQKTKKMADKLLQQRIINSHIQNNVDIMDNCQIDATVEIGKGSIIFNGNVIKGNTIIGNNVILKENNVINNCVIGDDVCISGSNLDNSKVENNAFILPFCYINNAIIRQNCYIGSGVSVENRTIRAGSKIQKEKK